MLEYDQNLPQEFDHKQRRLGAGMMGLGLALATVLLVYVLITLLPVISHHQL